MTGASADRARWRLCLVTDRRRLAAAVGRPERDSLGLVVEQVVGAVQGGVDLVQIREPDLEARALAELTRRLVAFSRPASVRIVVNDRLDVALAAAADGVHLREAGAAVLRVRRVVPHGFLVGRSVHGERANGGTQGADYLIAGHVFETASKPAGLPPLGLSGLERIVRAAGPMPVLAIGGIRVRSLREIQATGAAGVAAIGAFIPSGPVPNMSSAVQKITRDLRIEFDSDGYVP